MKNFIFSRKARQFVPKATFFIVSLFSALLLLMPTAAQAMTVTVTVDSPTHPVGAEVVVTAVADGSLWWPGLHYAIVDGPNLGLEGEMGTTWSSGVEEGTFTYVSNGQTGVDTIEVYANWWAGSYEAKGSATVEWVEDSPQSKLVVIGGWDKLKDKKWGGVTIAICGVGCTDSFNVYDVDLDSVQMAGVSPYRSRFRDSRLCPDGKDAYVDLVLRFKRREIVKALEEALGGELVDGEKVTLNVTGSLKDETPFEGVWEPTIKKIKKRHKWRR